MLPTIKKRSRLRSIFYLLQENRSNRSLKRFKLTAWLCKYFNDISLNEVSLWHHRGLSSPNLNIGCRRDNINQNMVIELY
jgi:hypothetical protein